MLKKIYTLVLFSFFSITVLAQDAYDGVSVSSGDQVSFNTTEGGESVFAKGRNNLILGVLFLLV